MGYLSGGHLWLLAILLIIVLIIWGPGKLPDVGSGLGRAIREFRKASSETRDEFNKAAKGESAPVTPASPAPQVHEDPLPAPLGGGTVSGPPPDVDPH
jgi:sec-independent protein translocase protein TatA